MLEFEACHENSVVFSAATRMNYTMLEYPAKHCGLAILLCTFLCSVVGAFGQTNDSTKILFLHIKIKGQSVSLLDTVTRPGVLKRPGDPAPDALHYEVFSAAGETLWKGALEDPTARRFEYEDPPGSGKLKRKVVLVDETEFTVRIPVLSDAQRVEFYKLEQSSSSNQKSATRRTLGTILLP
jgi:hypothetical protein